LGGVFLGVWGGVGGGLLGFFFWVGGGCGRGGVGWVGGFLGGGGFFLGVAIQTKKGRDGRQDERMRNAAPATSIKEGLVPRIPKKRGLARKRGGAEEEPEKNRSAVQFRIKGGVGYRTFRERKGGEQLKIVKRCKKEKKKRYYGDRKGKRRICVIEHKQRLLSELHWRRKKKYIKMDVTR